jgi:hypothetical protein
VGFCWGRERETKKEHFLGAVGVMAGMKSQRYMGEFRVNIPAPYVFGMVRRRTEDGWSGEG